MEKEIDRCTKLEEKVLKVLFGGYYKKEESLRDEQLRLASEYSRLLI